MTKRKLITILLFPVAMTAGFIGMFGGILSFALFSWFNPKYQLPDDKAGIDVAPVTKYFWRWYQNHVFKYWFPKSLREEHNRYQIHKVN